MAFDVSATDPSDGSLNGVEPRPAIEHVAHPRLVASCQRSSAIMVMIEASPFFGGRRLKKFSAEEKIRIVLTGLRGEDSIAELCQREQA